MTEPLSPEAKIRNVEDQYVLLMRGNITALSCPYCGGINPAGADAMCCGLMAAAVLAIIDRDETADRLKKAEAIIDRYSDMKNTPLVRLT